MDGERSQQESEVCSSLPQLAQRRVPAARQRAACPVAAAGALKLVPVFCLSSAGRQTGMMLSICLMLRNKSANTVQLVLK